LNGRIGHICRLCPRAFANSTRHSNAEPLEPRRLFCVYELRAVRYLWRYMQQYIEEDHRGFVVRMGLGKNSSEGALVTTEAGTQQLRLERHHSDINWPARAL